MRCPCRKKSETRAMADCCEPFIAGRATPPTAETLMRSRYTAYVQRKADYLLATWHPSTRPKAIDFFANQEWLQLKIIATSQEGDRATVAFEARSRIGGATHVLAETSRFMRENGRWFYVDGDVKPG